MNTRDIFLNLDQIPSYIVFYNLNATSNFLNFVKVVAEDKGKPRFRASAEVSIDIEDENDCAPKFGFQNYHFSIDEDVEPYRRGAREVGMVQASDCDIGPNAEIRYSFEETDLPFEVYASNFYVL